MNYISFNIKTNYQLLCSLIKIDDLVSFALKNDINTLAITDDNMFSFMDFYFSCKKNNIKPIVGVNFFINNIPVLLYAKNYDGYKELCNLITLKNTEKLLIDDYKKYNKNLICVMKNINKDDYMFLANIYMDLYINYFLSSDREKCLNITKNIIFMNEVLCLSDLDKTYLKYLYMIKDSKNIHDKITYNFDNNTPIFLTGEMLENIADFSSKINLELPQFKFELPSYSNNSKSLLINLCKKGLYKRLNGNIEDKYITRLNYELDIIVKMNFVDYFLIVYDIILYAKKNGIYVGPGRGSAVGSLVSYSLGIIDIDPLKYGLLFERFLNPNRISMPDIDIDISDIKREKLIKYITDKYKHVANIIAFSTLLPKQVIRDVGKILDISSKKIDDLSTMIGVNNSFESLEKNYKYQNVVKYDKDISILVDISKHLEGIKKNITIHAAGIVIGDNPLTNKVPLYKTGENLLISYDKKYLENLGILKIDLLNIRNLTLISNILDDIENKYGLKLNLNEIPLNDNKTLQMFKNGYNEGIFQYESLGLKNLLIQMNVDSFDDLIKAVAMYRPGPIKMIPTYLRRRSGKEKATYIDKDLEPILKSTLGIMIYQEQLLEILNKIGGYSYAEADLIRVSIKKKDESIMLNERDNFIRRSIERGYTESTSKKIYDLIIEFANYGFNKSHSVAYATLGYQMMYLKAHYKEIFIVNLLNDENSKSNKIESIISEAKIIGVNFEKLNINSSRAEYYLNNDKIIFPLSIIKNININVVSEIIKIRESKKFENFIDFVCRCFSTIINKEVIISFIFTGSFDTFGLNKRAMIENLSVIINYASLCQELGEASTPILKEYDEYDSAYLLEMELKYIGFYLINHPTTKYNRNNCIRICNVNNFFGKKEKLVLLVQSIKEIKTKNNDLMSFIKLSDETGIIDGILFPKVYNIFKDKISLMKVYKFTAVIEKRMDAYQLIIESVE